MNIATSSEEAVTNSNLRCRRAASRRTSASSCSPVTPRDQLEQREPAAVLAQPDVGGDRLGWHVGQAAVRGQLEPQRRRKALLVAAGIGFAADDQRQRPRLAVDALERQDFFVDPFRRRPPSGCTTRSGNATPPARRAAPGRGRRSPAVRRGRGTPAAAGAAPARTATRCRPAPSAADRSPARDATSAPPPRRRDCNL